MTISQDDFVVYSRAAKNAVAQAMPTSVAFVLITAMEDIPIMISSNVDTITDVSYLLRWALASATSGDMSRLDQ